MTTPDYALSQASFRYTIDIAGWGPPFEVDGHSGGEGTAQVATTRPGTSLDEIQVLGTPPTYGDSTVTIEMTNSRRAWDLHRFLNGKQGSLLVTIHRQPLDRNRDPFGDSEVRTATVASEGVSDYDKDAGDVAVITLGLTGGKWR